MMLRDLFLRRRNRVLEASGPGDVTGVLDRTPAMDLSVVEAAPIALPVSGLSPMPAPLPVLQLVLTPALAEAGPADLDDPVDILADKVAGPEPIPANPRRSVVLRRITPLVLDGTEPGEDRLAAILDRLSIVHDPNEVLVAGKDRSAQIVMANRRLMAARFCVEGREDQTFVFRQDEAPDPAIAAIAAALTAFCADPVSLVVTEQPVKGVFAVAGGLPVEVLQPAAPAPEPDMAELPELEAELS